tara:strand:+ start:2207 stop:2830 length:624 start_codon:yes stop_codon:yes gene_type:complete
MTMNAARPSSDSVCDDIFGDDTALNDSAPQSGDRQQLRYGEYKLKLQGIVLGTQVKKENQPFIVFEFEVSEVVENIPSKHYKTGAIEASNPKGSEVKVWYDLSQTRNGWTTAAKYNLARSKKLLAALFSEPEMGVEMSPKQITVDDIRRAVKSETQDAIIGQECIVRLFASGNYSEIDAWHHDSEKNKHLVEARAKMGPADSSVTPF